MKTSHVLTTFRGRGRSAIVALLLVGSGPAEAQETRAEAVRHRQADKQRILEPPSRNRAERIVDRLEAWGLFLGEPRGVYPWLGSVFPGGGTAVGAGVRTALGNDAVANVVGGFSVHRYWHTEASVTLPPLAHGRARITVAGRYTEAPDVAYHGVGNDTLRDDKTHYGYRPAAGEARLDFDASRHLSLAGGVTYLDIQTSPGRTGPSTPENLAATGTPGLGRGMFRYVNSRARATFDWRRPSGYSGSGGLYRVQFDDYREPGDAQRSFRSIEGEVRQLIPLLRANWVVALGGLATVTDIDEGAVIPYFLLPSLGGGTTVRGYPDFRFRDRHRLVLNAELRWTPARFLDMAVFYDAGKVASRRRDLDLDGLHGSYGIGMRVTGPKGYAFRVEVAHSREHNARLLVGAGGAF
jgi:hypothetical protein